MRWMDINELKKINRDTVRSYALIALKYHELYKDEMSKKEYDRRMLDEFASGFPPEALICDAGCGPSCQIGRYLFEKGFGVIGIDISPECVEIARRYNPSMTIMEMDMSEMAFADGSLQGIFSYYSIVHTPKELVPRIFSEFRRVIKVGGKLLVVAKDGETEGYTDEILGTRAEIYFSNYSEEEVKKYFADSGFRILKSDRREPYDFEISAKRVYVLGEK